MASLATIFAGYEDKESGPDNDKLNDLYWNRAQLKKQFADLREQNYKLQQRIQHHEGATARVEQQLRQIEDLLTDAAWVHNVMAYYQLRRLSRICSGRIARFAEHLKQQREQRVQSDAVSEWEEKRRRKSDGIKAEIQKCRMAIDQFEERLAADNQRLESMNGLLRIFRGRGIEKQIATMQADVARVRELETDYVDSLREVDSMLPPGQQGLDISSKRSVNLLILAYAQQLYLHFADDELADLSQEAGVTSVGAVNYGGQKNCDYLFGKISARIKALEGLQDDPAVLQQRVQLLRAEAVFRRDSDAVPVSASVSTLFDVGRDGAVKNGVADLLGKNYWGVARAMSG